MFCNLEDHEAGFKTITVTHRSGRTETLRLIAPSRRAMREARVHLLNDADPWHIVKLALGPDHQDETFLDKLDGASADLVESTAFALAFGLEWEKKMLAATLQEIPNLTKAPATTPNNEPSTNSAVN